MKKTIARAGVVVSILAIAILVAATDGRFRLVSSAVSPSGWHFSGNRVAVP